MSSLGSSSFLQVPGSSLNMATFNAHLKAALDAHKRKDPHKWTKKDIAERQQMNALGMAVSHMAIDAEVEKRVAKFENGGYDPDHKKPPSEAWKDAMKRNLMTGMAQVKKNMERPDAGANIQKKFDQKFAKSVELRLTSLRLKEMSDTTSDEPSNEAKKDANSDEPIDFREKNRIDGDPLPACFPCPNASSSSKGLKRPFGEVMSELEKDSSCSIYYKVLPEKYRVGEGTRGQTGA